MNLSHKLKLRLPRLRVNNGIMELIFLFYSFHCCSYSIYFRNHGTGRVCDVCYSELVDTIVHFGESGNLPWPLNWKGALSLLDKCDLILCIGSSLAVLKHYQFLWPKPRSTTQASLFFVNILKKLGVVHCCSFIIAILVIIFVIQIL